MSELYKPPFTEWFIDTYFFPIRRQRPDLSPAEVLEIAKAQAPFQVNMSRSTMGRCLRKMAKSERS